MIITHILQMKKKKSEKLPRQGHTAPKNQTETLAQSSCFLYYISF
jgi:hypothetical protein